MQPKPPETARPAIVPTGRARDGGAEEDGGQCDPVAAHAVPIDPSFRHLAESLSDLVWSALPDGSSDYYNRRFLEFLGLAREEMGGWTWVEMVHPDDVDRARQAWERARSLGGEYEVEFRMRRSDGEYRWLRSHGSPMRDDQGRITRWFGTCIDIEERVRDVERLRASETRYRQIVETANEGIWQLDVDQRTTFVNPKMAEMLGYEPGEMIGRSGWDFAFTEDTSEGERAWEERRSGGNGRDDFRLRHKDGSPLWVSTSTSPILDAEGRFAGALGMFADMTDRLRMESELRESEGRFRATFHQAAVGMARVGLDGRWLAVNDRLCRIVGYDRDELMAGTFQDITHPDDLDDDLQLVNKLLAGELQTYSMEKRYVRKDGPIVWVRLTVALVQDREGEPEYFISVIEDITDSKRAEKEMRASDLRLRLAVENIGMAWWDMDLLGGPAVWSSSFFTLVGLEPAPDGRTSVELWAKRVHPDDLDQVVNSFREAMKEGNPYSQAYRIIRADDGEVRWLTAIGRFLVDDEGRVARSLGIVFDDTVRRTAEERLRESEARWRTIAEALPNLVWTCSPDGLCDWMSSQWGKYTGIPEGELIGTRWLDTIHPDDRQRTLDSWKTACEDRGNYDLEYRVRRHDGQYRWFKTRGVPLRGASGRIVYWFGTCTDIEDVKRMEAEFRETDRRKDEFLAMLAHELRNPLAPIRHSVSEMALAGSPGEPWDSAREVIDRQVRHLSNLVDDLLDVGRINQGKITLELAPLDVADVAAAAVEAVRPLVESRDHRLEVELPARPLRIEGDLTRLTQVVLNLLNNAAKYTPKGGSIRLTVSERADRVVIAVRDDGVGIPAEMLSSVFDLFTQADRTLDRSEGGLGIGLTLVKRLTELHGGEVEARSDGSGLGSEFVVRLPLLKMTGAPARTTRPSPPRGDEPDRPNRRRILVVDDGVDAAMTLAKLLRRMGHEVETAHDGPAGVEAATRFGPDLAILDIGLPGMDGYELARTLRGNPAFRETYLVALTGYGSEGDRRRSAEAGFDAHMVKPIELDALSTVLTRTRSEAQGDRDPR